jgi:hypothetical protein
MGIGLGIGIGLRRHHVPSGAVPLTIDDLWLWLRADKGITLNGGDVAAWADQSGNGRDFAQATAGKQPLLEAAGIGGMPSIRFAATTGDLVSATGFSGPTSAEVFIICQHDDDPPVTGLGGLWDFGSSNNHNLVPFTDGLIYDGFGSNARKDTAVNPVPSFTSPRVYSVRTASGAWSNHLDGVQLYTTATNTVGWRSTPTIGQGTTGGGSFYNGMVAELVLFGRIIDADERTAMIGYLNARYGTTAV